MGFTMRIVRGRKVKDSKYTIRRSVKVHGYEQNGNFAVRITHSLYMGKTENDPRNRTPLSSTATVNMDTNNGTRRRYVAIT